LPDSNGKELAHGLPRPRGRKPERPSKLLLFADLYLACNCNGTEAARRAGYKGNDVTLRSVASENLTKPLVIDRLAEHRRTLAMDHLEAIQRMSEMARASL